ncbi:MAG: outer membrane lipoprotein-sorting protein [Acidobacteriaceae bacterium]|nr:outer membrane lipoprotein-sorting protein [Acidobacteriaceae bacterium]
MPVLRRLATVLFAAILFVPAVAQTKPADLDAVLRQMDTASTKFKSAEASFRFDNYERVVRETTTQSGTVYFLKNNGKLEMGLKIISPETKLVDKLVDYRNGVLRMFDPKPNQLTIFNAGKNQAQYESFLTLGFGGSGGDLAKAWTISDQGTESMNDGQKQVETRKLDLVSKDANVRNMFSHVTIWVDPARGVSLKQQFFTASGNTRTAFYTNIRTNHTVDIKPYAINKNKQTTVTSR